MRYRNIWVREFKPIVGKREREPYFHNHETGKETPVDKSSTVKGAVNLDGKPLQKGKISLHSNKGGAAASADVRDGKFEFDEVKPGQYVITVERTGGDAAHNLPKRYSDEDASNLKVEVKHGANELNFDLTAK